MVVDIANLSDEELDKGPEATEEAAEENANKDTDKKESEEQQEKPADEGKKDEFVFDKEAYEKAGITNPKALEMFEKKDKQNFHDQIMIDKQSKEVGASRKEIAKIATEKSAVLSQLQQLGELADDATPAQIQSHVEKKVVLNNQLADVNQREQGLVADVIVKEQFPDADELLKTVAPDIIRAEMKKDGLSEYDIQKTISYYETGMWKSLSRDQLPVLFDLLNKARHAKTVKDYEVKIADATKAKNNSEEEVAVKIKKAANNKGVRGGSTQSQDLQFTKGELADMDDTAFEASKPQTKS